MFVFLSYKKFIGGAGSLSNTMLSVATAFHRKTEDSVSAWGRGVGGVRLSSPQWGGHGARGRTRCKPMG